jgi:hypothetical protein
MKILNVRGELLLELDAKDLSYSFLRSANLRRADLRSANLCDANLCGANLCDANLCDANLSGADLYGANLCGANLRRANLSGADLRRANLVGANLCGANLYGDPLRKTPLTLCGIKYWCLISDNHMRLGCKCFTHAEWAEFTDEEISMMDDGALEFWTEHKSMLLALCRAHKGE